ncbi:DNA alkylation repair protein [Arthrobacter sp. MYb227]|uniref:DNA alkylation repair protein n=1 Tax=Arthrobacter sp. MYb227 TaxID=1848601 RepID=UPI000CFB22EA|nr:DNA alkylation repair protein [Arthrobacter sp. MYb227]PQZ93584.1 DNA alkylation repair protein [Arthrobacter sp. MYb227]
MTSIVEALTEALLPYVEPGRAEVQQAYMKTTQPFLGVRAPQVRKVTKELATELELNSAQARLDAATELFSAATHREHWYAAGELCAHRLVKGRLEFLPLYERMILEGAWWDIVDGCARRFGELLLAHPEIMEPLLRAWATDEFMWKRRMSMIAQLHAGAKTNTELLNYALEANLGDQEFFIRKALGWSLRQYGKTDPLWVLEWVNRYRENMSNLSYREAIKRLL